MPTYVVLVNWTEEGIRNVRVLWSEARVRLEQTYWIIGPYDIVAIMEALLLDTPLFGMRSDRCRLPIPSLASR